MPDSSELMGIEEIRKELPPHWEIVEQSGTLKLRRVLRFLTYMSGVEVVVNLAGLANALDHHPEIALGYKIVTIEIFTHSLNGVSTTDLQFVIAAEKILAQSASR